MRSARVLAALTLTGLPGCHGGAAAGAELPARLVEPTQASYAELVGVVAQAIGVESVDLPRDVLTTDSRLLIEQAPRRDLAHGRILGRDVGQPEQFQLVMQDQQCILIRPSTGERWPLAHAHCVAEQPEP